MAATFFLQMKSGPTPGEQIDLAKSSFVVGRDPTCDLAIDDVEVSRRHARLIAQSGGYVIEDLGSTNGTFVNGQRIRAMVPLKPGDSIGLGDQVSFVYQAAVPETESRNFAATPPSASRRMSARMVRAAAAPPSPAPPAPALQRSAPALVAPEAELPPASPRSRPRRNGVRLPLFSRPWMIGCAIVALLGVCSTIAFLWYIDSNLLWCDVFGTLITACR